MRQSSRRATRANASPRASSTIPRSWWSTTSRCRSDSARDSVVEQPTIQMAVETLPNHAFQLTREETRAAEGWTSGHLLHRLPFPARRPRERHQVHDPAVHHRPGGFAGDVPRRACEEVEGAEARARVAPGVVARPPRLHRRRRPLRPARRAGLQAYRASAISGSLRQGMTATWPWCMSWSPP